MCWVWRSWSTTFLWTPFEPVSAKYCTHRYADIISRNIILEKLKLKFSFQFSISWKIIRVTAYHSFKFIHNLQIVVSSFSGSRRCSWTEWTGWFPWCHRMNMFQLFSSFPFWSEFDFSKYDSYVQLWLIFHWFSVGLCTGSPWPHRKPRCRRSRRWKGGYWFNNNATKGAWPVVNIWLCLSPGRSWRKRTGRRARRNWGWGI